MHHDPDRHGLPRLLVQINETPARSFEKSPLCNAGEQIVIQPQLHGIRAILGRCLSLQIPLVQPCRERTSGKMHTQ